MIDELPEIIEWMSIHHDSRSIPRQHGLDIAGFDPVKYSLSILVCCLMASATFAGQKFDFEQFRDRLPWIWQSPRQVEPPKVKDSVWPADTVDRFVLRKLEAEKLKPAGPANDRVWVRRVYFAITAATTARVCGNRAAAAARPRWCPSVKPTVRRRKRNRGVVRRPPPPSPPAGAPT